ncbi:nucleotidyltransferase family protein [Treponema socranskii]|uniref:Nucleotidyltransferase domain protein n=1 Tax=Treponema socranskii subsp. socranskii VPI DR56BR1116 = ATCC 35536 TaxID=1125725 RepID=U1F9U0_TRESO|nr:nucleotidyltransferase domain-containing protein [Treponema socranskii]ERF60882.1 nucleotidyltransferase domain protein [Treponema socranskii subsp. socranskii VPI DR56BR1116 = ATCC 35536]ERJ98579.1 nucleotidyltransferase domain protein [Treponema socranskii subsp. socranskii VPI DR56BR1116 = ATCC 35536]
MTGFEKLSNNGIYLTHEDLDYIISKYNIKEISVFGSSIRNDFTNESDVDFLIEFKNSEKISLFDILDIQDYLQNITKRNVDIVEPAGLVNPYRREAIMNSREPLYVV